VGKPLAEPRPGADALQRPLRFRFQARLRPSVAMSSGVKRCDPTVCQRLAPLCGGIGRAGARQTRRVLTRLSGAWLPPAGGPSGPGLGLGTRVSCRRCTPTRGGPPRGGAAAAHRVQRVVPRRARMRARRGLRREGHGPQPGRPCARQRHHDGLGVLAARQAGARPVAQAARRLPAAVLAGVGPRCPAPLARAPARRRSAGRPRPFHTASRRTARRRSQP
jgi:hypothetical protein